MPSFSPYGLVHLEKSGYPTLDDKKFLAEEEKNGSGHDKGSKKQYHHNAECSNCYCTAPTLFFNMNSNVRKQNLLGETILKTAHPAGVFYS